MTLLHLIDWATGLASLGVKFIGYPSQFRRNIRARNSGLGVTPAAAMTVSYVLWVLHGFVNHDMTEVLSQGIGVLTCGSLLVQAWWYRRPTSESDPSSLVV